MLDFHRVLSNLSEVVSEHAKRRSGSSGSSSSGSEASDASAGGSGSDASSSSSSEDEAEQRQQQQKGKKRKAAAAAEPEPEAAAPKRVKAATHSGRYKKREAAKMVKAYSDHDLAAILGGDPFAAAAAAVPEVRAQQRAASSSGYDSDSEPSASEGEADGGNAASGKAAGKGPAKQQPEAQQQQQQPERPPMIVVRRPMPAACRPPQPATPKESRQPGWWQVCFHRAAGPGSVGGAAAGGGANITIHGFSEQDQTNLYNLAHVSGREVVLLALHGLEGQQTVGVVEGPVNEVAVECKIERRGAAWRPAGGAPALPALLCNATGAAQVGLVGQQGPASAVVLCMAQALHSGPTPPWPPPLPTHPPPTHPTHPLAGQGHAGPRGPGPQQHAQEGGGGALAGQEDADPGQR